MALKKLERIGRTPWENTESLPTILYVEDEDANWNVTELHLRGKYNLLRARNSKETFDLLSLQQFDLILLDIQLSGSEFDGIDICKIIKQRPGQLIPPAARDLNSRNIPVVFVTAYASRYSRETLLKKAGADDVITKPVDFTRLRLVSSRLIVKNLLRK